MPERKAASGTVHWIGTGLSTGSGLAIVCDIADRVVLYGRTVAKAEHCLSRLGLDGKAETRAFDRDTIGSDVREGDIVVSMLPAPEHVSLIDMCLERQAHFACSSYVSPEIAARAAAAEECGVVVLTESGLDPGIDHLLAHKLVVEARREIGDEARNVRFTSYCGGVPETPNEIRYRFSWAPRGVLTALKSPARYVDQGAEKTVDLPWSATSMYSVSGETFEVYPNRDSVPFVEQYGIPDSWQLETFVRGTLRLDGWRDSWSSIFTELEHGDDARITALAAELAARYPTTDADRDRVVLAVGLTATAPDGGTWSREYLMDMIGDAEETAMARCVSVPLACGIADIVSGSSPAGLSRAIEDHAGVERWLTFLATHGIQVGLVDDADHDIRTSEARAAR